MEEPDLDDILIRGFTDLASHYADKAEKGEITAAEAKVLADMCKHRKITSVVPEQDKGEESETPTGPQLLPPFNDIDQEIKNHG